MTKKPEPKKKSKTKRQGHNRNYAQSAARQMTKKPRLEKNCEG